MKQEQEGLITQTKRLTRDVAKLETALQIRQEEMRDMNSRAEVLERRILEGLVNQARAVKTSSKAIKKPKINPIERDASMSLKRVPSTASTATAQTSIKGQSTIGNAIGTALKKRTPLTSNLKAASTPRTSAVDRRILSTSHVTGNRGRNTPDLALMLAPVPKSTGLISLKRSQSVKSNPSSYLNGRKASWNGVPSELTDKENFDAHEDDHSGDESHSDADTERRTSIGTSYMYTDSMLYGTGSSLSRDSRLSTGTSCDSSIVGTINGQTESIAEEDEEDEANEATDATAMVLHDGPSDEVNAGQDNSMAMTTFDGLETPNIEVETLSELQLPPIITGEGLKYHGSDSGLGTEPLTAGAEHHHPGGEALEYFEMTAQDMQH
jgi:hypothetical protein